MGVPAADVDEADAVLALHEPRHPLGLELEALGVDRASIDGVAVLLLGHVVRELLAQIQAVAHRHFETMPRVHAAQLLCRSSNAGLARFLSDRYGG